MMIRIALGAGRGRIVRQLMVESGLLAASGAALGCLLAYVGIDLLVSRLPQGPLPGEVDITLNGPVLAFSAGAACLAAVLFGLAPALYTARRDLADGGLKTAARVAGGRGRLRNALVTAEIALSLVLVLSAGLLMRSFIAVMQVDFGFRPDTLAVLVVAFPPGRYTTAVERQRYFAESVERIGSLPGIDAVAATTAIPPFGAGSAVAVTPVGSTANDESKAAVQPVTADYFRAVGIPLMRGSGFAELAADEVPTRAVVNQTFARLNYGDRDPIGRQIRLAPASGPTDPARHGVFEIVGVARDVKNEGPREPVEPQVYLPWSSAGRGPLQLVVRAARDPALALAAIRRELTLVDRQVAVVQIRTLREVLDRSFYAEPRFSLLVLGIFAATGTLLVAIGVFSVMAYTISRQKKEIAVRMALGASHAHVYGVVLGLGARLLAAGIAIGLLASVATNRLLATQLWNVSARDPLTFAAATLLVSAIALIACYIPARRAMRVQPVAALRED